MKFFKGNIFYRKSHIKIITYEPIWRKNEGVISSVSLWIYTAIWKVLHVYDFRCIICSSRRTPYCPKRLWPQIGRLGWLWLGIFFHREPAWCWPVLHAAHPTHGSCNRRSPRSTVVRTWRNRRWCSRMWCNHPRIVPTPGQHECPTECTRRRLRQKRSRTRFGGRSWLRWLRSRDLWRSVCSRRNERPRVCRWSHTTPSLSFVDRSCWPPGRSVPRSAPWRSRWFVSVRRPIEHKSCRRRRWLGGLSPGTRCRWWTCKRTVERKSLRHLIQSNTRITRKFDFFHLYIWWMIFFGHLNCKRLMRICLSLLHYSVLFFNQGNFWKNEVLINFALLTRYVPSALYPVVLHRRVNVSHTRNTRHPDHR